MSEQSRSHTRALVVMLTIAATSVACSKTAPECGSPEVTLLVSSLTSDGLFGSLSASLKAQASQEVTFAVRDALKGKLEQDGARRTCAATLVATFSPRTKEGVDNVLAGNSAIVFEALKGSLSVAVIGAGMAAMTGNQIGTDKVQILKEIGNLYQAMDASDLAQLQQSWNPSTRTLSVPIEYSINLLEDNTRFQVQPSASEDLGRLNFIVLLAADAIAAEGVKSNAASPPKPVAGSAAENTDSSREETVIVREYQLNRDYSATLVVDRIDYNQKDMNFNVTPEDAMLHDFLKANLNVPLVVTYDDDPVPFFVTAARRK